jgi:hypothetical protein
MRRAVAEGFVRGYSGALLLSKPTIQEALQEYSDAWDVEMVKEIVIA